MINPPLLVSSLISSSLVSKSLSPTPPITLVNAAAVLYIKFFPAFNAFINAIENIFTST